MRKLLLAFALVHLCVVFALGNKVNPKRVNAVAIKKASPSLELAKKTTEIAQHAHVLRSISKQLHNHAEIAPLKKALRLEKLSKDVKRKASQKDQAVATIIKKTLPQSMHGLRTLKKNSEPTIKTIIKRMIQKVGTNLPPVSVKRLNNEAKINHKRGVQIGKQTVHVLRNMKTKGEAITPKRAAKLVKKTLSNKRQSKPELAVTQKTLRISVKPNPQDETKRQKVTALRKMVTTLERSLLRLMGIPQTIK